MAMQYNIFSGYVHYQRAIVEKERTMRSDSSATGFHRRSTVFVFAAVEFIQQSFRALLIW